MDTLSEIHHGQAKVWGFLRRIAKTRPAFPMAIGKAGDELPLTGSIETIAGHVWPRRSIWPSER